MMFFFLLFLHFDIKSMINFGASTCTCRAGTCVGNRYVVVYTWRKKIIHRQPNSCFNTHQSLWLHWFTQEAFILDESKKKFHDLIWSPNPTVVLLSCMWSYWGSHPDDVVVKGRCNHQLISSNRWKCVRCVIANNSKCWFYQQYPACLFQSN